MPIGLRVTYAQKQYPRRHFALMSSVPKDGNQIREKNYTKSSEFSEVQQEWFPRNYDSPDVLTERFSTEDKVIKCCSRWRICIQSPFPVHFIPLPKRWYHMAETKA